MSHLKHSAYRIERDILDQNTLSEQEFQSKLIHAYTKKIRPVCLCIDTGIPMYIAKVSGKLHIKRMPNTGSQHHSNCQSYEPPAELSGLGQLLGTAIQEDAESGAITLKLDYALTKVAGRVAPVPSSDEPADSVTTDGNKMTILSTLNFLWEEAQFNRWTPAMKDKRNWYVIRKYLIEATQNKHSKGTALSNIIFIPETFRLEEKDNISHRRNALFTKVIAQKGGARSLLIGLGDIKEIGQSRYGYKIVFKQLPDCPFMLNEDVHKRLKKRFEKEMGLWNALDDSKLIAIFTFSVNENLIPNIEEIALMNVTAQWMPFDNIYEKHLIDAMTNHNRRFIKGARYNQSKLTPMATLVATDTANSSTAMYIIPPGSSEAYQSSLDTLINESGLSSWVWRSDQDKMPALPELA